MGEPALGSKGRKSLSCIWVHIFENSLKGGPEEDSGCHRWALSGGVECNSCRSLKSIGMAGSYHNRAQNVLVESSCDKKAGADEEGGIDCYSETDAVKRSFRMCPGTGIEVHRC